MRRQITVFMGHLNLTQLLSPTIWLCINMSGNSNVVKCTNSLAYGLNCRVRHRDESIMVGFHYLLCIRTWDNGDPQTFRLAVLNLSLKIEANFVHI